MNVPLKKQNETKQNKKKKTKLSLEEMGQTP